MVKPVSVSSYNFMYFRDILSGLRVNAFPISFQILIGH